MFNKLLRLEQIASKWSNRPFCSSSFSTRLDCICIKVIHQIDRSFDFHLLAEFFSFRNPSTHRRRTRRLFPLLRSRKAFFSKSFVKYSYQLLVFVVDTLPTRFILSSRCSLSLLTCFLPLIAVSCVSPVLSLDW